MRIMVLTDGETFSPVEGCSIVEVPDDLSTDDIEVMLKADEPESVAPIDPNQPIFVTLWESEGVPNCNLYKGTNALLDDFDAPESEILTCVGKAVAHPGEGVVFTPESDIGMVLRYMRVQP